jgi:site-specific DNA recombinase
MRLRVRLRVPILDSVRPDLASAKQRSIVRLLVEKLIVSPPDIEVQLRQAGIEDLALELRPTVPEEVAA